MRKFQVMLILYRQLWPYTLSTSLLMWALAEAPLLGSGKFIAFLILFFWLRTPCQLLIWYLFRLTNQKGFVFYNHFGLSEIRLACFTYLFDLIIFMLWIILTSLLFN